MQRKYFISVLLCTTTILASCTDVWDEHYQSDPELNANETLWELIEADPELEKFEQFLRQTGYDSLLTKNRFYTVWAPIGDFSYNEGNIDLLEKEFVQNHIANYSHVAGGKLTEDNFITMLNGKYLRFENSKGNFTFKGLPLTSQNISAKNGILHKIEGYADYVPNLWEQLEKEESVDSLYQFLFKDYKREFDRYSSVQGPTVDGQVTYLDSVFVESNPWFTDLGELNREDSLYTMFALTNEAWDDMYEKVSTYFNYSNYAERDSVRDQIVRVLMCKNLVFSEKVNAKYLNNNSTVPYDTLKSNYRLRFTREPLTFAGEEVVNLFKGARPVPSSNGTLYIVDQVNYDPIKCWHDTIRSEAEGLVGSTLDGDDAEDTNFDSEQVLKSVVRVDEDSVALFNSISGGAIASFEHKTNVDAGFKMSFDVKNVLSAPYRIKLVVVPPQIVNPADTIFIQPTMFYAQLVFANENKDVSNLPISLGRYGVAPSDTLITNCERIDTIILCPLDGTGRDYVEVPICEFEEVSRFNEAKLQTKLSVEVIVPTKAGSYKAMSVNNKILLRDNKIKLNVAESELLAAEEKYQAALEDAETDPELLEAYLEAKEECEDNVTKLIREIEKNQRDVERYSRNAKYDNVLRIDQVIFEPINIDVE